MGIVFGRVRVKGVIMSLLGFTLFSVLLCGAIILISSMLVESAPRIVQALGGHVTVREYRITVRRRGPLAPGRPKIRLVATNDVVVATIKGEHAVSAPWRLAA
jgi:hypothetical protein